MLLLYNKIDVNQDTKKIVKIKENSNVLIPKLLGNRFIMQNRRLKLDYKAMQSWLFSFTKLIW